MERFERFFHFPQILINELFLFGEILISQFRDILKFFACEI